MAHLRTKYEVWYIFYQIPTLCYRSSICHNTCKTECDIGNTDHHSSVSTEMLYHDDSFETVLVETCLYLIKNTARFIMFSMITNIYNKKTKRPTLMELFTATGKLKVFFSQLAMFDMCTTGNKAHIDTIFKFLPHKRQHGCIDILHCCNNPCLLISEVTWQWWDEYFARNTRRTVTIDLLV